MMGLGALALLLLGQAPHDLDCRGRFEVHARIEPTRILVGEEVTLTLRIVALGPWKRGPQRPPLAEDPILIAHFRVRDLPDETPSRFPEGVTGPPGTAWEFSWKLTPLPNHLGAQSQGGHSESATTYYPAAIPEIGLILTREDVPWPRLAQEWNWVGPFALTYRQVEALNGKPTGKANRWVILGVGLWLGLTLIGMLFYERALFQRAHQTLCDQFSGSPPVKPLPMRRIFHQFLEQRGLVLPAEPDAQTIFRATLRAGYPQTLASRTAHLWNDLENAAFGPVHSGTPPNPENDLARELLSLAASRDWHFWKRRISIASV